MMDDTAAVKILEQVKTNLSLTLSDLLKLLKDRVGLSTFQLSIMAGVDPAAFNKVMNGKEGRLLDHEAIAELITGLVSEKHLLSGTINDPDSEAGLWVMALQSAASADRSIAMMRQHNKSATEDDFLLGRISFVQTLRELWKQTGGRLIPTEL
jgi:hypothetical protein